MAETDNHCPDENSTNGNNNGFDSKGDLESGVDTASHYSLEDAATRVELALRKTLKLDECNNAVYCSVYEEPGADSSLPHSLAKITNITRVYSGSDFLPFLIQNHNHDL